MNITNPPKALILMLALVCLTLLMALNRVDQNAALPMISAIIFYGIGNGVAAKTGKDSPKIFGPKNRGD
jgi:hypothetical protein